MTVQNTSWLTLTNVLLGAAVVLCALFVALGASCELLAKLIKRKSYEAQLDHDMDEMFASAPFHQPHKILDAAPLRASNGIGRTSLVKEVLMNATTHEPLQLSGEEFAVLAELLESERTKLLVEIRHTDHRAFRNELRRRLALVESMVERCQST